MFWVSLAVALPPFAIAVLRRTRAWWLGGVGAIAIGFALLASGFATIASRSALDMLGGIALMVYGFVLLLAGASLHERYLRAAMGIPVARARAAGKGAASRTTGE